MNEQFTSIVGKLQTDISGKWISVEDAGRLIELTIQECATVVGNVTPGYNDYRSQIEENMRDYCKAELLAHFGVKQQENT